MRILAEPRDLAELTEIDPALPSGTGDRFSGYGVIGLPFASGHILALRRFPASSLGYGYSSVWHRTPEGRWTFWSDVAPEASCSRFFGSAIDEVGIEPIRIRWIGPRAFAVSVGDCILDWRVRLRATPATILMNGIGACLSDDALRRPGMLRLLSALAGPVLGVGRVRLTGLAPNGHHFIANPLRAWRVSDSQAVVRGTSLGAPGPLAEQAVLGDFAIPQAGVFVIGRTSFECFDAASPDRAEQSRGAAAVIWRRLPALGRRG